MAYRTLAPLRRRLFAAPLFLLVFVLVFVFLFALDARSAHAQETWHVDDSVNDGLVALWRFDDPSAVPTMYDLVGGNHGTAIVATVAITNNRPIYQYISPGVLDLRGFSARVEVPDDPALNTSDEFTLAAWVYRGNSGDNQTIFDAGMVGNNWRFYIDTGNRLAFGPQGLGNVLTSATIPLAQWTHVAVVVTSAE